jgi:signal transduction histidine kinase
LPIDAAAELAVLESLLFLSCRQYELFGIRGTLSEQLANLKLQELHARLMAHEATKTLGGIRDALDLIQQATYDSEGPLGRLARGDLGQLRGKANVDLHTVVVEIHERLAARMDKRHVRFDDRIPPRTFAFVDKDAIRYTVGILIDNASVHGGGLVRIWAEHCSSSDGIGLLVVRVANNGGPMPPQTEADIRNGSPPVRGLKTGQHDEGYGAGLHLAFQFSHLNGWILAYHRVDNDPEGLTHLFSLELPVQA